ncbi:MAG: MarR family winged helix-turn-helix transcriptional regulator [Xanthomonadales bacterium]|jgi:DNA-binding MarR family transcriptional regulator|nr:MarR family winged helix-turn-helix transcriptional regulator [Xanthomonadales bacterium]
MNSEACFNLHLRQATRVMNQIYDQHLAQCALKTSQFAILRTLYFLGEVSQKQLQEALVLEQTTLTRNLQPLLRDGFLQIRRGSDRRQRLVSLTPLGQDLCLRAEDHWKLAQDAVRQRLGPELSEDLLRISRSVVALKN